MAEMWLPLWLRIMSATGSGAFNLKIQPLEIVVAAAE